MTLTISKDSATLTQNYRSGENSFVKKNLISIFNADYSLDRNNNLILTYNKAIDKMKLEGKNEDVDAFIAQNLKNEKENLDKGNITREHYDKQVGLLDGRSIETDLNTTVITTVRLDAKNNRFYLIETKTDNASDESVKYSYHSNGNIKSITTKISSLKSKKVKYDEHGYKITDNVKRTYYENGIVKTEFYPNGYTDYNKKNDIPEKYYYDEQGLLIAEETYSGNYVDSRKEFEYNKKGINILQKNYSYKLDDSDTVLVYSETELLGYKKTRYKEFDIPNLKFEKRVLRSTLETVNNKIVTQYDYIYMGEEYYGYKKTEFDGDGKQISAKHYDKNGKLESTVTTTENRIKKTVTKYADGSSTIDYYDTVNKRSAGYVKYNSNGTRIEQKDYYKDGSSKITYYNEKGKIYKICTCSADGIITYSEQIDQNED